MKDSGQDQQRRQHVFRILDHLKESGERINADKIARLAKMGKQTVLPYYNEWRYLGFIADEQTLELPVELVRGLQQSIANWKHQLSGEHQRFEESANQEIDELKEKMRQLLDENERLAATGNKLQASNEGLASELDALKQVMTEKKQERQEMEHTLNLQQQENKLLRSQMQEQKVMQQQALSALEKQMDQRHQEQLNHWLSVVDDERRLKQALEKRVDKLNDQQQELKKENLELHNRLESKSKAYIRSCEERAALVAEQEKVQAIAQLASQMMILLDCNQDELLRCVRDLQTESGKSIINEQRCSTLQSAKEQLEEQLAHAQERIYQLADVELELERARGAAEAYEKVLPGQAPGVKQ